MFSFRAVEMRKKKESWSQEEDDRLVESKRLGLDSWDKIAEFVRTRSSAQCCQRWNRALKPSIKKGAWSPEEVEKLRSLVESSFDQEEGEGDEAEREKDVDQCGAAGGEKKLGLGERCGECGDEDGNGDGDGSPQRKRRKNHDGSAQPGTSPPRDAPEPQCRRPRKEPSLLERKPSVRWAEIAKYVPGRTDLMCRSQWKRLERRRIRESKAQLMQERGPEYIKALLGMQQAVQQQQRQQHLRKQRQQQEQHQQQQQQQQQRPHYQCQQQQQGALDPNQQQAAGSSLLCMPLAQGPGSWPSVGSSSGGSDPMSTSASFFLAALQQQQYQWHMQQQQQTSAQQSPVSSWDSGLAQFFGAAPQAQQHQHHQQQQQQQHHHRVLSSGGSDGGGAFSSSQPPPADHGPASAFLTGYSQGAMSSAPFRMGPGSGRSEGGSSMGSAPRSIFSQGPGSGMFPPMGGAPGLWDMIPLGSGPGSFSSIHGGSNVSGGSTGAPLAGIPAAFFHRGGGGPSSVSTASARVPAASSSTTSPSTAAATGTTAARDGEPSAGPGGATAAAAAVETTATTTGASRAEAGCPEGGGERTEGEEENTQGGDVPVTGRRSVSEGGPHREVTGEDEEGEDVQLPSFQEMLRGCSS